jgi:hypothetical protein
MREGEKIALGVVSGVLGIVALFGITMLLVGKGDKPVAAAPLPVVARPIAAKVAVPPVEAKRFELTAQEVEQAAKARASQRLLDKPANPLALTEQPPASSERSEAAETPAVPRTSAQTASTREAEVEEPKTPASSETSYGTTATGIPTYVGPRGGVYHYSKSGNKVYERRSGGSRRR